MSGATVAAMLADLIGPAANADARATPAKAANPAKSRASIDGAVDFDACEGLRISANLPPEGATPLRDSQVFANLRSLPNAPRNEHSCGPSQDSQDSRECPGANASGRPHTLTNAEADAAHAEPWDDAACARFVARVSLFLRRGFDATDADDLAERLHLRDLRGDDRRLCVECRHLTGGRHCGNAERAGVMRELPPVLVTTLQRCAGFAP